MKALLVSPLVALVLVGWTRLELSRVPAEVELGRTLGAEALAVLAVERLWTAFDIERGADAGTLEGFRGWLDARGVFAGVPVAVEHDEPLDDLLGGALDRVLVERVDRDASVELAFARDLLGGAEAIGRQQLGVAGGREVIGAWSVTRRTWAGSGYALLGRDLDCALCHVTVRPAPRTAHRAIGSDDHVRVGILGDLVLRSDARVDVHGTLHLAGALLGADSEPIAAQECSQLRFAALGADLALQAEASVEPRDLAPLAAMDLLRLRASDGLLLGRYRGGPRVLRRALPGSFPGFDDVRPTQLVAAQRDRGRNAARAAVRGFTGGRGGVVPQGGSLDDLDAGAPLTATARISGHLWAVGTASEPLHLAGDIEVEGDLVIGGVVRGRGSLRARGMVLVVGSLRVEGQLALVAGTDLLAGASIEGGALARFVRDAERRSFGDAERRSVRDAERRSFGDAERAPLGLPSWVTPERLGRMGDRADGPLVLEAFCYAPRHVIVVAPRRSASGTTRSDVHVRGGLVADVVAVHAPGELVLEDDPETRALLAFRAPEGLELHARPFEARARAHQGR